MASDWQRREENSRRIETFIRSALRDMPNDFDRQLALDHIERIVTTIRAERDAEVRRQLKKGGKP